MCGCPRCKPRVHPHIIWALALLDVDLGLLVLVIGLMATRTFHL